MKTLLSIPLLVVLVGSTVSADQNIQRPIIKGLYGEDNRRPVSELDVVSDEKLINYSKPILAQIPNWRITDEGNSISIKTKDLESGLGLCSTERFLNEPLVSSCTAFLVAPNLIVTAGHCIKDKYNCKKQTWVLGYDSALDFLSPNGAISFSKDKTYSCAELVSWSQNSKLDYALVRLDRAVEEGITPLKIRREGKVSNDEMLVTIGHPLGMPKMVAEQIFIRDNSATYIFKTNSDTFSGNSGSPVIGVKSGLVEGILVRGDEDFMIDVKEGCSRAVVCDDKECRGESVQRSTFLPLKYIPKL